MPTTQPVECIHTRIWHEEPEADNPYATRRASCHGYDVYGEMVGQARWVEMLYLLFRGDAPTPDQADLLEALAVVLANAGPRDPAVHAAMCAGVGGSPAASVLMAALAVGAGQHTGAREVYQAVHRWHECGTHLDKWQAALSHRVASPQAGIWPACEHAAGFDPHAPRASGIVLQALDALGARSSGTALTWLSAQRTCLEEAAGCGLAMTGVAAAALFELGFSAAQAEMIHLLLRLPGAAAHALEQQARGFKTFPFFALDLQDDPMREKP